MREELIQKHFSNQLSEEELHAFHQLKEKDADFLKEVHEYESLMTAVQSAEKEQLKSELQTLERKRKKTSLYSKFAVAASFIGVIGIGSMIFMNSAPSGTRLFADNFEAYPNVIAPITRSANPIEDVNKYFVAYEKGEYATAISGFKQQLKENDNADLRFYLAMALLNSENEDDALLELNKIDPENTGFYPQVLWYKALILIEQNDFNNAKNALNELIDGESEYKKEEAKKLIQKL